MDRAAIVAHDVMAVRGDGAGTCRHDAADNIDQSGLTGAVRPEQRKNLAFIDVEIDKLQGLKA